LQSNRKSFSKELPLRYLFKNCLHKEILFHDSLLILFKASIFRITFLHWHVNIRSLKMQGKIKIVLIYKVLWEAIVLLTYLSLSHICILKLASTDGRKRHKEYFMSFSETKTELFQADTKTKLLVYEWLPDQ
jgi:hypothetical protein